MTATPTEAVTRIGLVACAAAKLDHPASARDLYTSALFRKASAFAEATCDRWYVLSAKHGLLSPDTVVEPYDVVLGSAPHAWAERVREQLAIELRGTPRVVLVALAGEKYRTFLRPCQWPFEIPMRGLGIGQQLAWLSERNAA